MKSLIEFEIAKSYEGKPYNQENLRSVAMGYGVSGAIIYYGRLSKTYFDMFGITEDLLDHWLNNGISYSVVMDLNEDSNTIKHCHIAKHNNERLTPTQQEITIFQTIMEFITKG